jgi:ankyrin repeat protein
VLSFIKNIFKGTLRKACKKGDIEAVKQYLAAGANVNAGGVFRATPLHLAAWLGHKEIAELLITNGADVNAKKAVEGETPLHEAAAYGNKEIAELLIVNGANVNVKDKGTGSRVGRTALNWADGETADLLRKHGGKTGSELRDWNAAKESIHIAAKAGHIEAVKKHLIDGVDVNAKDKLGSTPLHSAAYYGRKEVGELLIANGADVNAMGDYSITPLDRAFAFEHSEIAALLRKHGGKTGAELKAEGK